MGLTALSWILSVATIASCKFFQLDYFSDAVDGFGIFGKEDGLGGCDEYPQGFLPSWERGPAIKAGRTFGVGACLALAAAVILHLVVTFVNKSNIERERLWVAYRATLLGSLACVLFSFSFVASDPVKMLCHSLESEQCSVGPAGAAAVMNVFLLVGLVLTSVFVEKSPNSFSTNVDCCCSGQAKSQMDTARVTGAIGTSHSTDDDGIQFTVRPRSSAVLKIDSPMPASQSRASAAKAARKQRLNSNIKVLYHQTSQSAAESIRKQNKMTRGTAGLVGGGIYFTEQISETHPKAHNTGYIVIAKVKLGKVKNVSSSGDSTITYRSLLSQGYDSVHVKGRSNGDEFVVYNSDQVEIVDVSKI